MWYNPEQSSKLLWHLFSADIIKPLYFLQPLPSLFTIQSYSSWSVKSHPHYLIEHSCKYITQYVWLNGLQTHFMLILNDYSCQRRIIIHIYRMHREMIKDKVKVEDKRKIMQCNTHTHTYRCNCQLISTGGQWHLSHSWPELDSLSAASCRFRATLGSTHPAWQVGSFGSICLS